MNDDVDRSVREDLAAARGQERGEAKVGDRREVAEPGVQRDVPVLRAVPAHPADVARRQRHGLRPHGTQRAHRAGGARRQERPDGGEALERDVRQAATGSHTVAHSQGLRLTRSRLSSTAGRDDPPPVRAIIAQCTQPIHTPRLPASASGTGHASQYIYTRSNIPNVVLFCMVEINQPDDGYRPNNAAKTFGSLAVRDHLKGLRAMSRMLLTLGLPWAL